MGRDKATLVVDGVAMAVAVATALREAGCAPVVAVGGDPVELGVLGLRVVPDLHPGAGPVGGILTALTALSPADQPDCAALVVAACDLRRLDAATVERVLAGLGEGSSGMRPGVAMAVAGGRDQPLCAAWRFAARPLVQTYFDAGGRSALGAVEAALPARVAVAAGPLHNFNSPEDAALDM